MKESITIKQINVCRAEAEEKILNILVELNKETGLIIDGLTINDLVVNTVGGNGAEQLFNSVVIDLKI